MAPIHVLRRRTLWPDLQMSGWSILAAIPLGLFGGLMAMVCVVVLIPRAPAVVMGIMGALGFCGPGLLLGLIHELRQRRILRPKTTAKVEPASPQDEAWAAKVLQGKRGRQPPG